MNGTVATLDETDRMGPERQIVVNFEIVRFRIPEGCRRLQKRHAKLILTDAIDVQGRTAFPSHSPESERRSACDGNRRKLAEALVRSVQSNLLQDGSAGASAATAE